MRLALLAFALAIGAAQAAPSAWMQERTRNFHRDDRRFDSIDYGFSVVPPPAAAQYVTNGGDANHGPIMILGEHRDIVVYPDYMNSDLGNTRPCANRYMPGEETGPRSVGTTRLGREHACLVTFTHGDTVSRFIQATGRDRAADVIYTFLLTTTRRWARKDFASFQSVADSFRRVPIYP